MQQTNKLYRETAENELLLKEQINSLQKSLQRYKEQCQVIPNLEVLDDLSNKTGISPQSYILL